MKKVLLLLLLAIIVTGCGEEKVINITIEQYCENGTPENGQCKVVTSIPAETGCPEGFPLNPESKYCERVISTIAERYVTCDPGFTLVSGKCISDETYPKNEQGRCNSEHTSINGECKEVRYRVQAYRCPMGNLNEETHNCDFPDQKTPEVTCPEGYIINMENLTCDTITYEAYKEREVSVEEQ